MEGILQPICTSGDWLTLGRGAVISGVNKVPQVNTSRKDTDTPQ
jgi:hypothetical protein